jgi:hypothetical protein
MQCFCLSLSIDHTLNYLFNINGRIAVDLGAELLNYETGVGVQFEYHHPVMNSASQAIHRLLYSQDPTT